MSSAVFRILLGRRTMAFFAIFFALGALLPLVLSLSSYGSVHIGFPYAFRHDEGSIPGGRAWTEWDVFFTDVAIYYGLAVVMGLVPVLRGSSSD